MKATGALYLCHVPRAGVTHEVVEAAAMEAGLVAQRVDRFGEEVRRLEPQLHFW